MESRGHHVICISAIVLVLLSMTCAIHGNQLVRLPNPTESPLMKNQSFYSCNGKMPQPFSFETLPKRISCDSTLSLQVVFTPERDIRYLDCKYIVKWNGIVWYSQEDPAACDGLNCPLIKGKTYQWKTEEAISPICLFHKGNYIGTVNCSDEHNEVVFCFIWSFTMVK